MLARCTNRTSAWTTSDICGRNSGSGCQKKYTNWNSLTQAYIFYRHTHTLIFFFHHNTCTQRAITSAKRDRDLTGYNPFSVGSTILANASMSWSWGVAHRTKDCSCLALELLQNVLTISTHNIILFVTSNWAGSVFQLLPIKWSASTQKLQHDNPKAVDITFKGILTRQRNFGCIISRSNIMV